MWINSYDWSGLPQWGHAFANRETICPQSGHGSRFGPLLRFADLTDHVTTIITAAATPRDPRQITPMISQ